MAEDGVTMLKRASSKKKEKKDPIYEEDIIDGFSFFSFKTYEDLESVFKPRCDSKDGARTNNDRKSPPPPPHTNTSHRKLERIFNKDKIHKDKILDKTQKNALSKIYDFHNEDEEDSRGEIGLRPGKESQSSESQDSLAAATNKMPLYNSSTPSINKKPRQQTGAQPLAEPSTGVAAVTATSSVTNPVCSPTPVAAACPASSGPCYTSPSISSLATLSSLLTGPSSWNSSTSLSNGPPARLDSPQQTTSPPTTSTTTTSATSPTSYTNSTPHLNSIASQFNSSPHVSVSSSHIISSSAAAAATVTSSSHISKVPSHNITSQLSTPSAHAAKLNNLSSQLNSGLVPTKNTSAMANSFQLAANLHSKGSPHLNSITSQVNNLASHHHSSLSSSPHLNSSSRMSTSSSPHLSSLSSPHHTTSPFQSHPLNNSSQMSSASSHLSNSRLSSPHLNSSRLNSPLLNSNSSPHLNNTHFSNSSPHLNSNSYSSSSHLSNSSPLLNNSHLNSSTSSPHPNSLRSPHMAPYLSSQLKPANAVPLPPTLHGFPPATSAPSTNPTPSLYPPPPSASSSDFLRRELDSRFLATAQDLPSYMRPPAAPTDPFLPPLAAPYEKYSKLDPSFYGRNTLGLGPTYQSLSHLLTPGSTLPPPLPVPKINSITKPKSAGAGKWCAMHIRIAWLIYHSQQQTSKQPRPPSFTPSMLGSTATGTIRFDAPNTFYNPAAAAPPPPPPPAPPSHFAGLYSRPPAYAPTLGPARRINAAAAPTLDHWGRMPRVFWPLDDREKQQREQERQKERDRQFHIAVSQEQQRLANGDVDRNRARERPRSPIRVKEEVDPLRHPSTASTDSEILLRTLSNQRPYWTADPMQRYSFLSSVMPPHLPTDRPKLRPDYPALYPPSAGPPSIYLGKPKLPPPPSLVPASQPPTSFFPSTAKEPR